MTMLNEHNRVECLKRLTAAARENGLHNYGRLVDWVAANGTDKEYEVVVDEMPFFQAYLEDLCPGPDF